jgi:hypothetical protein
MRTADHDSTTSPTLPSDDPVRKLRSAQHGAALDLDLALTCLRNGCLDTGVAWIERAAARLYREGSILDAAALAAPVADGPAGGLAAARSALRLVQGAVT